MQAHYPNEPKLLYYQLELEWKSQAQLAQEQIMVLEFAQLANSLEYSLPSRLSGMDWNKERKHKDVRICWKCITAKSLAYNDTSLSSCNVFVHQLTSQKQTHKIKLKVKLAQCPALTKIFGPHCKSNCSSAFLCIGGNRGRGKNYSLIQYLTFCVNIWQMWKKCEAVACQYLDRRKKENNVQKT